MRMKFIHLSDTHLLSKPQTIHGVDPRQRLNAAVDCICSQFSDAAFCMVTGDLTDTGNAEDYAEVRRILDRLPFPWHPLLGNHDNRSVAKSVLDFLPWNADGFLQYELETDAGMFIILDSLVNMRTSHLCRKRLDWLQARLDAARSAGKDVYIFMHHVPFDIGIQWLDRIQMQNGDDLWAVLKGFGNIRHMFFGHVHRPVHGSWHGIPFSTVRATAHQVALQLGDGERAFIDEEPSFAVVLLTDDQVVIHDHDFLRTANSKTDRTD